MEINKPVAIIILLIINSILIFLFIVPKYQESNELQASLVKKQAEYDGRSDYSVKLLRILKDIEGRKDTLEKINSALPSDFSLSPVVYFLQKKATENQLTVKSIIFQSQNLPEISSQVHDYTLPATKEKEVKNVTLAINLSGSYQGFKNFLYSLDKSTRLFQVSSISFSSPQSLSGLAYSPVEFQTYNFKLEVKVFTY